LDEPFLGRSNELLEFEQVLRLAAPQRRLSRQVPDGPDEAHVILVYGLGGIGKSTLLRRFRRVAAENSSRKLMIADTVDCEIEQRHYPGEYGGLNEPPIWRILDRLYAAVRAGAAGRTGQARQVEAAFEGFRQAMAMQPQMTQRAMALGIGAVFGRRRIAADEAAALSELAGTTAQALGALVPGIGAVGGPVAKQATAAVLDAATGGEERQVSVAAYDALIADLDRLVSAFAAGLRQVSRRSGPVVVVIDTGELLGGALDWLRNAMRRSGRNVVWVLGLRLEAESDAGLDSEAVRFRRSIDQARLRPMQLASFDDRTAAAYLANRLGAPAGLEVDINAVMEVTRGIPLAVSLLSDLLASGQDPAIALAPIPDADASQVSRELARRYLVHARTAPALQGDLPLLYGLALLGGKEHDDGNPFRMRSFQSQTDPEALATLWDTGTGEVAGILDALARRHDFVLSGQRRLHQEVRGALQRYLLDPLERPAVTDMNIRAAALYRDRADSLGHQSIDGQFHDQRWQDSVSAHLWHTFWASPSDGMQLLCQLSRVAALLDEAFMDKLAAIASFFGPALSVADRQLLEAFRALSPFYYPGRGRLTGAREAIERLMSSGRAPLLAASPPTRVYNQLLQARNHQEFGLTAADQSTLLLRASKYVTSDGPTARAITSTVRTMIADIGNYRDSPPDARQQIAAALHLLTRYSPNDAIAHNSLGHGLHSLGRYAEAEAAYRDALRADPDDVVARSSLPQALHDLGRYAEAEAAYRDVLRADPDFAIAHGGLGNALYSLGRYAEAEAAYRDALRADPDYAIAHNNLGVLLLRHLGRLEDAREELNQAIRADPGYAGAHSNMGGLQVVTGDLEAAKNSYLIAAQAIAPLIHPTTELMLGALETESDVEARQHFSAVLDSVKNPRPIKYYWSPFRNSEVEALALVGLDRSEEAVAILSAAFRQKMNNIDVLQSEVYAIFTKRNATGTERLLDIWRKMESMPGVLGAD
jgi:tetratricopeptide (TPR) repeat protein